MILLAIGPAAFSTIVAANGPYFMAANVAAMLAGTVVLARRATMQVKRNAGFNNIKRNPRGFAC
jgi:mannitol-specific phosphotransferase system IIBC component